MIFSLQVARMEVGVRAFPEDRIFSVPITKKILLIAVLVMTKSQLIINNTEGRSSIGLVWAELRLGNDYTDII